MSLIALNYIRQVQEPLALHLSMAKASKKASAVAAQQEAENLKKKKMAQKKAASDSEVI